MPRQRGGYGDLHARVRLTLPDSLSDEQRELFERLRGTTGGAPGEGRAAGEEAEVAR